MLPSPPLPEQGRTVQRHAAKAGGRPGHSQIKILATRFHILLLWEAYPPSTLKRETHLNRTTIALYPCWPLVKKFLPALSFIGTKREGGQSSTRIPIWFSSRSKHERCIILGTTVNRRYP